MPKVPTYTLAWSSSIKAYELYETRNRGISRIVPDSPEWFAWLDQVSSFVFSGKTGHYTARKEPKQRGGQYWYAYLTTGERLTKKYLGKSVDITLAQLEHIAGILSAQSETQMLPPASPAASADTEIGLVQHPMLAQQGNPLNRVLATKLRVPRLRTQLVLRSHLIERLKQSMAECPLTLVSAPAGFGKTTLLAQWLADSGMTVAWVSLEPEDNDPSRFLLYMIAALQTLDSRIGTTALALLRTPQPPSPEGVLAMLTNELTDRGGGDFALVLDDYHTISAEPIHRGMTFLMEHLPPQMHLILATRADPPLPLARLRARGQLCEVRTADLRFGTTEVSMFLQAVMGLDLPSEAIATLGSRAEGWIAGLQLVALSLHGRADISGFLTAFAGTHRFVLDYLSEEVLLRQPAPVMAFLLHTCILERLSGPLCDAVTEQVGSQAILETLDKANLFVISLDDERHWYRYHHLFVEVLRSHLQQTEPMLPPILHRRASNWYEQHDLPGEAVHHALAIPDADLAARLIEPITLPMTFQGQIYTVLDWIHALPDELVRARPFLSVYYARLLMYTNQLEAAEARVQEVERSLLAEMPTEQARIIQGWVLSTRAGIAGLSGNATHALALARRALELLPEAEAIPRTGASIIVARACEVSGDVTQAIEHEVAAAVALIRSSDNPFAAVSSITLLAHLHVLQGRLQQAAATYAQLERRSSNGKDEIDSSNQRWLAQEKRT
jgi:LuxR family maltose regulon positive regulatory protein